MNDVVNGDGFPDDVFAEGLATKHTEEMAFFMGSLKGSRYSIFCRSMVPTEFLYQQKNDLVNVKASLSCKETYRMCIDHLAFFQAMIMVSDNPYIHGGKVEKTWLNIDTVPCKKQCLFNWLV